MRRIILMALTALTLTGGVAAADRDGWRGGRDHDRRDDRRDHRWQRDDNSWHQNNSWRQNNGWRDNNSWRNHNRNVRYRYRDYDRSQYRVVRANRSRPVFRDNRWYFSGGFHRTYSRPVFNVRYTNYYAQPQAVAENYETVPGYIWIAGNWQWNGYEWNWVAGRYEVDTSYQDNYYDGSVYYDYGY